MSKNFIKNMYRFQRWIKDIEDNLDLEINKTAELYMLIYIKSLDKSTQNNLNAIIIAHGYSTASSIAGVANRLFSKYILNLLICQ